MEIVKNIILVLDILCSICLIAVISLQSGKEAGLNSAVYGGNNSSYLGKGKGRSLDAKLAAATKWVAAAFVVLTIASLAFISLT